MAAPTEVYIDPSIAGNSGTGSSGDPYGDIQYALDTETRDTSNGNRFNIKSGTDEILTATLDFTTFGTPGTTNPLIIQGYTSTAGDGGQGGISGNGSYSIVNTSGVVHFVDMHLHNSGSNAVCASGINAVYVYCEIDNATGNGITCGTNTTVYACQFSNIGSPGNDISGASALIAAYNFFANGGSARLYGHITLTSRSVAYRNIGSDVPSLNVGIYQVGASLASNLILQNSLLGSSGNGTGIAHADLVDGCNAVIGNVVENFGTGIQWTTDKGWGPFAHNAVYNCTTAYQNATPDVDLGYVDNETLSSSGFDKSGSNNYANRLTYFNPADSGNVLAGSLFGEDKGAVQSTSTFVDALIFKRIRRYM